MATDVDAARRERRARACRARRHDRSCLPRPVQQDDPARLPGRPAIARRPGHGHLLGTAESCRRSLATPLEFPLRGPMDRVKTALVGCGKVGQIHAQALATLAESELVGVCDVDAARASAFAARY